MPGQPSPSAAESATNFDLETGAPTLVTIDNFEPMMAANTTLPLPPVAGNQWATTPFNQSATLNPLQNDVAYAGAAMVWRPFSPTRDGHSHNRGPGSSQRLPFPAPCHDFSRSFRPLPPTRDSYRGATIPPTTVNKSGARLSY
jgi:hypothetical protein